MRGRRRVGRRWAGAWHEGGSVDLVKFLFLTVVGVGVIVGLLLLVHQCTAGDSPT